MTRVNCVPVGELHYRHLVSEYRELPRVFGLVRAAQGRGVTPSTLVAPTVYTMGAGHVKFFYPRLGFLLLRQLELVDEMRRRSYTTNHDDPTSLVVGIDRHWLNDWTPDDAAVEVSRSRLREKLRAMGVVA